MSIRILKLAAGAAFQDAGRPGLRRLGVPSGGAFDRESYLLALRLVGRSTGAVLEIPAPGAEIEATDEDQVAICGAIAMIEKNERFVAANSAFAIQPGDRLVIRPLTRGIRVYVASRRGWRAEKILGSFAGIEPEAELEPLEPLRPLSRLGKLSKSPTSLKEGPLRILPGPHARPGDLAELAARKIQVSLRSNRVGLRLTGGEFSPLPELTSEPSCLGAVQLAPSGELLVHGPDGPTVGGYPKIAVVAEVDHDRLGQLRPLQEVTFQAIALEEAFKLRKARAAALAKSLREIEALVR